MRPRVLVAKPGLDGHDRGAKVVVQALAEGGCEVVYTGLRQTPEAIARAARDEAVDVVGLSILSGAHVDLARRVLAALRSAGVEAPLVVGGAIPRRDVPRLAEIGVARVFGSGSRFEDIVAGILALAERP